MGKECSKCNCQLDDQYNQITELILNKSQTRPSPE